MQPSPMADTSPRTPSLRFGNMTPTGGGILTARVTSMTSRHRGIHSDGPCALGVKGLPPDAFALASEAAEDNF